MEGVCKHFYLFIFKFSFVSIQIHACGVQRQNCVTLPILLKETVVYAESAIIYCSENTHDLSGDR